MKIQLSMRGRNLIKGYLFVLPWIIGFAVFTIYPIIYSVIISLNDIKLIPDGIVMKWMGLGFYNRALNVDTSFKPAIGNTVFMILCFLPIIIVFSLVIALLLCGKYKFRTFFRAVFFLPVIIMSGPVISSLLTNHTADFTKLSPLVFDFINSLPSVFSTPILYILNNLVLILWFSGIQILMFLSGIQKISPDLYEAADIDGAGNWEKFWKITLPHLYPFIGICAAYTVIDLAAYPNNDVNMLITKHMFDYDALYSYSAAMSWIYLGIIVLMFAALYLLFIIFGRQKQR